MIQKKILRIVGIVFEPGTGAAEAKTVAPGIHVGHDALPPHAGNVVGENDLQVTNSRFFEVIATGIPVKPATPVTIHADDMAGLMKK